MREKLYEAFSNLQRNVSSNNKIIFELSSSRKNKSVTGGISINDCKTPKLSFTKIVGYNHSYIKGRLRKDLKKWLSIYGDDFQSNILPVPIIGEIIRTTANLDEYSNEGDLVNLPAGTRYYSVEDSIIDCNGSLLPEEFEATYEGYEIDRCSEGEEDLNYYKYKLISMV